MKKVLIFTLWALLPCGMLLSMNDQQTAPTENHDLTQALKVALQTDEFRNQIALALAQFKQLTPTDQDIYNKAMQAANVTLMKETQALLEKMNKKDGKKKDALHM